MAPTYPISRARAGFLLAAIAFLPSASHAAEPPASAPASAPATRPVRPTNDQIRAAIRQLSHPVLSRRKAAIRQFAEWGPIAFPELRRVIQSGDHEAALSAHDLLRELEAAILIGAQVRLEVDRPRAAWNEPITLFVHAHNPSGDRIIVPWPAAAVPATQPAVADARQVGALLDAADFIIVTGPAGEPIEPRVDPIERDPLVYAAVNTRARGTPPSHAVPAGASDSLFIPLFNRGWARYPMLDAGRYTIAFAYQPEWKDPSWTREGFGLVRSEPVTLEITQAAPEPIRAAHTPLILHLRREAARYVAELESTWDRDLSVNLNLGELDLLHGQFEWRLFQPEGKAEEEPVRWVPASEDAAYRPQRVHAIKPGGRLVIGAAAVAELEAKARLLSNPDAKPVQIVARYSHVGAPQQIRDALHEQQGVTVQVARDLFSGALTSEPLPLETK